jgi:fluoride ion exporter CrcB/FEX
MHRFTNLLIGFIGVIPGIIMALGLWHSISVLPELGVMISRTLGSFVIIAVIAFLQEKKDIKRVSQFGIAVGFLWTLTAMMMELDL